MSLGINAIIDFDVLWEDTSMSCGKTQVSWGIDVIMMLMSCGKTQVSWGETTVYLGETLLLPHGKTLLSSRKTSIRLHIPRDVVFVFAEDVPVLFLVL